MLENIKEDEIKQYVKLYVRFLHFGKKWWKFGIVAGLIGFIVIILQLPMPLLTRYTIDKIFPEKNLHLLNIIALVIISLTLFNIIANYVSNLFLFIMRSKLTLYIQHRLFQHLEHLGMSFYDNIKVGYLVSRLCGDASQLQNLMADSLLNFIRNVLIFTGGLIALLFLNWKLALYSMLVLPLLSYSIYFFSNRIRVQASELQEKTAQAFNVFFETLHSIVTIKAFCLEEQRASKAADKLFDSYKTNFIMTKYNLFSSAITSLLGALGPLLILWLGGREIIAGRLTLGGFVAFNSYLGYLYSPVYNLVTMNQGVQSSLASLKRVFALFDLPTEEGTIPTNRQIDQAYGHIAFNNVSFSYGNKNFVIKKITLDIKPSEKIAIFGKSGAGKSTLIKLLLKFYTPQLGCIFIDGQNIVNLSTESIRRLIGVVYQTPMILSGTIEDNIKIGKLTASKEEVIRAAQIANLYDFIISLPLKFDTDVGDSGVKLSGGERQRLAIARVILKNPKIIIMDEATSEVDSDSEKLIYSAMDKLCEKKTVIIIAHKLYSILHADKIAFMVNGEIMGCGCHEELYKNIHSYKQLYDEQFRHGRV